MNNKVTKMSHNWLEVNALSACDAQAGMTRPTGRQAGNGTGGFTSVWWGMHMTSSARQR